MKVFLSHKMHGVSEEEIIEIREKMMLYLHKRFPGELIDIIDNYHHNDAPENAGRVWHLGRSIQMMEEADLVVFHPRFIGSKGCRAEFKICKLYDIPHIVVASFT